MPAPTFLVGGTLDPSAILIGLTVISVVITRFAWKHGDRSTHLSITVLPLNCTLFYYSANRYFWEPLWLVVAAVFAGIIVSTVLQGYSNKNSDAARFLKRAYVTWTLITLMACIATSIKVTVKYAASFPLWVQVIYQITWMIFMASCLCGFIFAAQYLIARKSETR